MGRSSPQPSQPSKPTQPAGSALVPPASAAITAQPKPTEAAAVPQMTALTPSYGDNDPGYFAGGGSVAAAPVPQAATPAQIGLTPMEQQAKMYQSPSYGGAMNAQMRYRQPQMDVY